MAEEEPPDLAGYEPLKGLGDAIRKDLLDAVQLTPAAIEALVEGDAGPTEIPPEQVLVVLIKQMPVLMARTARIADEVERLSRALAALEQKTAGGEEEDPQ